MAAPTTLIFDLPDSWVISLNNVLRNHVQYSAGVNLHFELTIPMNHSDLVCYRYSFHRFVLKQVRYQYSCLGYLQCYGDLKEGTFDGVIASTLSCASGSKVISISLLTSGSKGNFLRWPDSRLPLALIMP